MPTNGDDRILRLTKSELLASIGADLTGKSALPSTAAELVARAQAWLKANANKIRGAVCPHAQKIAKETDTKAAVIAVADLISSVVIHVAPFKVAALVIKVGVEKVCADSPALDLGD